MKKLLLVITCLANMLLSINMLGCGGGDDKNEADTANPSISVSDEMISFSSTVVEHSADKNINIQNSGDGGLTIGQIASDDTLDDPFTIIDDQCSGRTLESTETCNLQIRFNPVSQNIFSDTFNIPSNDPNEESLSILVEGEGQEIGVSMNQIVMECPNIKLIISVTDRYDNPLNELLLDDFNIYEDEDVIDQNSIVNYTNQIITPISIVMALDNSNSIIDHEDIQSAAITFIEQIEENDEAAIVKFATTVEITQSLTNDKEVLADAINTAYSDDDEGTLLYDALHESIILLNNNAVSGNRRAIILLSDGEDQAPVGEESGSISTYDDIVDEAKIYNVPIFTIGFGDVNGNTTEILQKMASDTGGQFFDSPEYGELENIYAKIISIFSNQYLIEYISNSTNNDSINIMIEVYINDSYGKTNREIAGC